MSWDQGVEVRENLPPKLVAWVENLFETRYGYKKELEYICWFGNDPPIYWDFGPDHSGFDTECNIDQLVALGAKL